MYPSFHVQNNAPAEDSARFFISCCMQSNVRIYEHICLWIIEQIFWTKTAFWRCQTWFRQTRHRSDMGVWVWTWMVASTVSLTVCASHSISLNLAKWTVGCLNWPRGRSLTLTGSQCHAQLWLCLCDAEGSHTINSKRCKLTAPYLICIHNTSY